MSKIPELLDLLQEECAEVIQNVSKVRRFGLSNEYLNGEGTQQDALVKEIADMLLLVDLLEAHGLFDGYDLNDLKIGDFVNLERCMSANGRFDGHIVQGHVDITAICKNVINQNGSWEFEFEYPKNKNYLTVEKGSVTVNGVSLTVVKSEANSFSVCIIPFTFEHTNFKNIKPESLVNIEFDVIGKYIRKIMSQ